MLLEPVKAELCVMIEVIFGEKAVDERESCLHSHRSPVRLEDGGVFREDSHTGADDGLRKIHRSYP